MKFIKLALAAALVGACLVGCDGRPCLESHFQPQYVPVFNGKTTTYQMQMVYVCDKYGEAGE